MISEEWNCNQCTYHQLEVQDHDTNKEQDTQKQVQIFHPLEILNKDTHYT